MRTLSLHPPAGTIAQVETTAAAATRAREKAAIDAAASQEAAARALAERDVAVARVMDLEAKGRKRARLRRWVARVFDGDSGSA